MRWSELLIPTLREAPADAEIASHKLLIRAGLARKLGAGIYSFLPLGLRALRKIENIIREEMNAAGAQEVLMPALQPVELWKRGPRYTAAQKVMFRASTFDPATESELVLGPTHEEVITDLVANSINSYRQLPRIFYQIQTKFRAEIRPRFGLMRAREFSMKDAYSFDVDEEGAKQAYQKMYKTYERIFKRVGLKTMVVEADTGVMGGSFSHEFSVPCEIGESEIVFTDDGSYAAAIEKAVSYPIPRSNPDNHSALPEKFPTPNITTIEDLKQKHGIAASDQIKTLVYFCDRQFCLFLLRGDHQLNEAKVATIGFEEFRPATDLEIKNVMGASPGSLGAVSVNPTQIFKIYADEDLRNQRGMVTGANETGYHLRYVNVERDIRVDEFRSLRLVNPNETSSDGKLLKVQRAIEVGHVFKLGNKYSVVLGASFLNQEGQSLPMEMGCYGIGVTRTLQALIEQNHDNDGIIWPNSVAPFTVLIILLDKSLESQAVEIKKNLEEAGLDCLLDDREERPGIKFKDADLIGFPIKIIIGEKSWAAGGVEVKRRRDKTGKVIPFKEVLSTIQDLLQDQDK